MQLIVIFISNQNGQKFVRIRVNHQINVNKHEYERAASVTEVEDADYHRNVNVHLAT